jgi:hypothetical protein
MKNKKYGESRRTEEGREGGRKKEREKSIEISASVLRRIS